MPYAPQSAIFRVGAATLSHCQEKNGRANCYGEPSSPCQPFGFGQALALKFLNNFSFVSVCSVLLIFCGTCSLPTTLEGSPPVLSDLQHRCGISAYFARCPVNVHLVNFSLLQQIAALENECTQDQNNAVLTHSGWRQSTGTLTDATGAFASNFCSNV